MNILVSACLLGAKCRYNGKGVLDEHIAALMEKHHLIPFCPEIYGGLPTPRVPAERVGDEVVTRDGKLVTEQYQKGAREAWKLAQLYGCRVAILKERSPACGHGRIYDGSHSGRLIPGDGVMAELLIRHGIRVLGESDLKDFQDILDERFEM